MMRSASVGTGSDMQTRNLIGGEWVGAGDGREFAVLDPATDREVARVPEGGEKEAKQAIEAAAGALPAWRARTAWERARILRRFADLMLREQDRLARLMTSEQGKPLAESKG